MKGNLGKATQAYDNNLHEYLKGVNKLSHGDNIICLHRYITLGPPEIGQW